MFSLFFGIFLGLWIALIVYGLSHDVRRWWLTRRQDRAIARLKLREQTARDLRESFRGMCH